MQYKDTNIGKGQLQKLSLNAGEASLDLYSVYDVIVPILIETDSSEWKIIGTGFFITSTCGLLITAKHVVDVVINDDGSQKYPLFIIQCSYEKWYIRPIDKVNIPPNYDFALISCKQLVHKSTKLPYKNRVLPISKTVPQKNDNIHTVSYPCSSVKKIKDGTQNIKLELQPYPGKIKAFYPEIFNPSNDHETYVKRYINTPCFETTMVIHSGASGGPVFNSKGKVFGVNHRGWVSEQDKIDIENRCSFVTPLHLILKFSIESGAPTVEELIKQNKIAMT